MDNNQQLFWLSWYQPTEDYRPLTFPPNEGVLGWWCTGMRCDDGVDAATLVAMVKADTEEAAKEVIKKDWPEAEEWRFCEIKTNTNVGDRFKPNCWMIERINEFNN